MSDNNGHWREEELIDYVLRENVNQHQDQRIRRHLQTCSRCRHIVEYWQAICEETEGPLEPKEKIKRRIYRSLVIDRPIRRRAWVRPLMLTSIIGIVMLSGFLFGRMTATYPVSHSQQVIPAAFQKQNMSFAPTQPTAYNVLSVHESEADGYVWMNRHSNDFYLFLNGLKPVEGKDYQVWLVTDDKRQVGGVLQFNGELAHVYVHHKMVGKAKTLIVSLEPQGGSQIQTGPKTVHLDLPDTSEF
ncbi:hypothetical protein GCM10011391_31000 [Pullulanibacillus camelliae]|uniref:Anti-sigma K factor RskA C-terminal domain-containing protein n=1 Tax=Pullulanibacillus camelliae TaxID=1707096 RepID=A0A8J2YKJ2_9BACL|nr:anti-sigma factor [Pullulanibacillus camelliae]GGE50036.1 hypothetical protein GCM10011391_31000 [Pullulanibacillus camelliae]